MSEKAAIGKFEDDGSTISAVPVHWDGSVRWMLDAIIENWGMGIDGILNRMVFSQDACNGWSSITNRDWRFPSVFKEYNHFYFVTQQNQYDQFLKMLEESPELFDRIDQTALLYQQEMYQYRVKIRVIDGETETHIEVPNSHPQFKKYVSWTLHAPESYYARGEEDLQCRYKSFEELNRYSVEYAYIFDTNRNLLYVYKNGDIYDGDTFVRRSDIAIKYPIVILDAMDMQMPTDYDGIESGKYMPSSDMVCELSGKP